jgi:hypothetical protein
MPPDELAWVLVRAFAPPALPAPPLPDPAAALALAERLGLLPRIAVRGEPATLAAELGATAAARLRDERALATARELRFDETLAQVADAAQALGTGIAPLKGRALVLAGDCRPGERPSCDLDLLVPGAALEPLHAELRRRGFAADGGVHHDHHLPALRHPSTEAVELHRYLPGVRLEGAASARWNDLDRAGLLVSPAARLPFAGVRVVAPAVRLAHALVHALAQHGHTARLPGWLLVGDLLDLGVAAAAGGEWRGWIARELADEEIDAALDLAAACGAGRDPLAAGEPAGAALLARHFLAAALDGDYAEAIKTRFLEAPMREGSLLGARWRLLRRALVPPAGAPATPLGRAGRWLRRPFELAVKAARSLAASRRVTRGGSAPPPLGSGRSDPRARRP